MDTQATLSNLKYQLANFQIEFNRYPTTAEGLNALVTPPADLPQGKHPFMENVPQDGWQQPFVYHCPGTGAAPYDLHSLGPDGIDGTADDIFPDPAI